MSELKYTDANSLIPIITSLQTRGVCRIYVDTYKKSVATEMITLDSLIDYLELGMFPFFSKMTTDQRVDFMTQGLTEGILLGDMIFADTENAHRIALLERQKMLDTINKEINYLEECKRCLTVVEPDTRSNAESSCSEASAG